MISPPGLKRWQIITMSILYQDNLLEITDEEIVFHRYYFPLGSDKRVSWTEIESVRVKEPSFFGGSWRLWGTGDLRTWYPQDNKRPSRDRLFTAYLRNSVRRIGFTVEDSEKVTAILEERGLLERQGE